VDRAVPTSLADRGVILDATPVTTAGDGCELLANAWSEPSGSAYSAGAPASVNAAELGTVIRHPPRTRPPPGLRLSRSFRTDILKRSDLPGCRIAHQGEVGDRHCRARLFCSSCDCDSAGPRSVVCRPRGSRGEQARCATTETRAGVCWRTLSRQAGPSARCRNRGRAAPSRRRACSSAASAVNDHLAVMGWCRGARAIARAAGPAGSIRRSPHSLWVRASSLRCSDPGAELVGSARGLAG
jgi:hypothetical protein